MIGFEIDVMFEQCGTVFNLMNDDFTNTVHNYLWTATESFALN